MRNIGLFAFGVTSLLIVPGRGKFLDRWCEMVMRSGIAPMKAKARMLQSHRDLILNYFRAKKDPTHTLAREFGTCDGAATTSETACTIICCTPGWAGASTPA